MSDPTPEARLAAALGAVEEILAEYGLRTYDRDGIHRWRCEYPDRYGPCECFADMMQAIRDAFLAADPTLAADLALAAAVRRLEGVRASAIQRCSNGRWRVYLYDMDPEVPRDGWHTAQAAWDLTAAIEEALRDD